MYALILDYIFGLILVASFMKVPAVKRILEAMQGTRHLERYTKVARTGFFAWTALLLALIILVFVENFVPAVYKTTHIALILNNINQILNTLQFYSAFQLLRAIEFIMKLATGRKKLQSRAYIEGPSSSDAASDAIFSTPSMRELFSMGNPSSSNESPGNETKKGAGARVELEA
jgi:hypothetical protein